VRRWRVSAIAALVLAVALAGAAEDEGRRAKPKPRTRQVEATRQWAYQRLQRAHEALAEERYDQALAALDEMQRNDGALNASERAMMHQTYGYAHASLGRHREAAAAFEAALASDALPDAGRVNVRYNLAQLYVVLERYDDAIGLFRTWLAEEPDPPAEAHYMVAVAYLQTGRAGDALPHAREAVRKRPEAPQGWLQLLLSLLIERRLYTEAVPLLERLIAIEPKKAYWTQLSAVHSELGQPTQALAALEGAYAQGLLTSERELTTLAQLRLHAGVPYKAARLLAAELDAGRVAPDAASWRLLADAWLIARERDEALAPLGRAAERSGDGALYLRLAQIHLDREEWEPARDALTKALAKGKLDERGTVYLLLGAAHANLQDWAAARAAFESAAAFGDTRESARQWLASIESELATREQEAALQ